jgi:hypothetical protein
MNIKNNGITLGVSYPNGKHRGNLVITKTQLIWCEGKTKPKNGSKFHWNDFINYMNS